MLDPQQQAAAETTSLRALVVAGAGSGKTRTLIERIACLIEDKNVSPYEIMSFSFTRKSAGEIKSRLVEREIRGCHNVTTGTMHSVALQMVKRFGEMIGLRPSSVTVYSEWEESYLLKEIAIEMGVFKKTWKIPKRQIDAMFSAYYERGEMPSDIEPGRHLFNAFFSRCNENNALTYGSLLVAMKLLIPTMAKHLHIRHILVDEVQDIDPLQWQIINGMCEAFNASLFAVGDPDQSIYAFRGAVPEYLVEHQEEFDVYLLESNYRSVNEIVEASNRLIRENAKRIDKTMQATRIEGESRVIVEGRMDSSSIAALIGWMKESLSNLSDKDMAILARNHFLLKRLDEELSARDIAHTYIGQKTALTNSEPFRRLHAFLKLLVNPYDNFSFLLIRDLIGLSPQAYAEIRLEAAKQGKSHFQAWHDISEGPYHDFFSLPLRGSLGSQVWLLKYAATGAMPFKDDGWPFDVDQVFQFVFSYLIDDPHPAPDSPHEIENYLSWLATFDVQDEVKEETEGIQIMTIHAAKGLEWPTVIVAGCNEGILPSKPAVAAGEIEEERRLFYVAMTRARDQLVLAVRPEVKEIDGKIYENPVSRFVVECG